MPKVSTLSQPEAEYFKPQPNDLLISIATPDWVDEPYPEPKLTNWANNVVAKVRFHDSDPKKWDSDKFIHMNRLDAHKILAITRLNREKDVYVHCWAGQSRSNAVARFLSYTFDYTLGHCAAENLMNMHVFRTLSHYQSEQPLA